MPFIEDRAISWEECASFVKRDISKLERAIREGKDIALDDSFPIRSLISTFNGYGPSSGRPIEDVHGVSGEFRLAICLEHSISLVVSSLIQLYYRNRDLVYELDEKAADIKAAQSILKTLVIFIGSYRSHFEQHGAKYEAVRRDCDRIYIGWHDQRARRSEVCRIQQCLSSSLFTVTDFGIIGRERGGFGRSRHGARSCEGHGNTTG